MLKKRASIEEIAAALGTTPASVRHSIQNWQPYRGAKPKPAGKIDAKDTVAFTAVERYLRRNYPAGGVALERALERARGAFEEKSAKPVTPARERKTVPSDSAKEVRQQPTVSLAKVREAIETNGHIEILIGGQKAHVGKITVAKGRRGWPDGAWITDHSKGLSGPVGFTKRAAKQAITERAFEQLRPEYVRKRAEFKRRAKEWAYGGSPKAQKDDGDGDGGAKRDSPRPDRGQGGGSPAKPPASKDELKGKPMYQGHKGSGVGYLKPDNPSRRDADSDTVVSERRPKKADKHPRSPLKGKFARVGAKLARRSAPKAKPRARASNRGKIKSMGMAGAPEIRVVRRS